PPPPPPPVFSTTVLFFNFAWEDMTTPHLALLADIVRVACSCLLRG
ncbi:unnamed protein product, partial [Discosporangium mesarthrocarpum]